MLKLNKKKAQTTAEYAIVIAIVVGAVVAMQVYIKRGLQGRIKDAVDFTGDNLSTNTNFAFKSGQYEPYYLATASDSQSARKTQEVLGVAGEVGRGASEYTSQQRVQRIGTNETNEFLNATASNVTEADLTNIAAPDVNKKEPNKK